MKQFTFSGFSITLSDKAHQCCWDKLVLLDESNTIFEGETWIEQFANATTFDSAAQIFNNRFNGQWQIESSFAVVELSPQPWPARKSMVCLFRHLTKVNFLIFLPKDGTPNLSYNSFDDINHHYVNQYCLFAVKHSKKGFYILSMGIGYVPMDTDAEYLYMVWDENGKVVKPFAVNGPWSAVINSLTIRGYL